MRIDSQRCHEVKSHLQIGGLTLYKMLQIREAIDFLKVSTLVFSEFGIVCCVYQRPKIRNELNELNASNLGLKAVLTHVT